MKKYEIYTDSFSFPSRRPWPDTSAEQIRDMILQRTDNDPILSASFDNQEDALAVFDKEYAERHITREQRSNSGAYLLTGDYAYLEICDYNEEGEFLSFDCWARCNIEPYTAQ